MLNDSTFRSEQFLMLCKSFSGVNKLEKHFTLCTTREKAKVMKERKSEKALFRETLDEKLSMDLIGEERPCFHLLSF